MPVSAATLQSPQGDFGGFPQVGVLARFHPSKGTLGPVPGLSVINGNVIATDGTVGVAGTTGFFYLGSCAGVPTGTPPTFTGRTPVMVDSSNNTMYYYSNGAWIPLVNGGAGTGSGVVRIAQVVTSGSSATIDFSSISAIYTSLELVLHGQDTKTTSADVQFRVKINGDGTAANYSSTQFTSGTAGVTASNAVASSTSGSTGGNIPGTSGPNANAVGINRLLFANYAQTVFWKEMVCQAFVYSTVSPTQSIYNMGFLWKSTAAINQITLTAGGTAFTDGTIATLYGMP